VIIVNNVSKYYGDFCALKNINLELVPGVYGLLAPNGAGKTTLIKMLATLIFPTEGEILYEGKNILDMDEDYRKLIGYLPQQFGFYKNYTPKQYLTYLAALKGIKKKEANQIIPELLEKVSLQDVMNKKMKKFSGGMIQRVGIAQALLNDPKILILDEPTAGLDPKERARFRHIISELSRNRIVLISTHIVSDVESIANEIVMIKNQEIFMKDSVERICKNYEGFVYETKIKIEEFNRFSEQHFIIAERQEQDGIKVRFVEKNQKAEDWVAVDPNLEDVFLYEYRDREKAGIE